MSLHAAIAARYPSPSYACFFEVADATGARATRRADAVVVGCWPSRGLDVIGIEVKVDRRDWLRELRDPAKSAPVQRYCDRWYLAVSDRAIVQKGELPSTWGMLSLRKGKLVEDEEAPKLEAEPMSRLFLASLLRSAAEKGVPRDVLDARVESRVEERLRVLSRSGMSGEVRERRRAERLAWDLEVSERRWRDLEAVAGEDVARRLKTGHDFGGLGRDREGLARAICAIASGGVEAEARRLSELRDGVARVLSDIDAVLGVARRNLAGEPRG